MKRKVIKQGNNTLTITLPKGWTTKYGVKAGDEIEFEELQKGLMLHVGKIATKGEIEINTLPKERFTRRPIFTSYIHGYDTIKVRFHEKEAYRKIEDFSNYLLGFEIVEQKDNYCILKNIAKGMEGEFDTIANRLFLLITSTGNELFEAIKNGDNSFFQEIENFERSSTKLAFFCMRMINTKSYKGQKSLISLYRIICTMEELADIYRDIGKFFLKNNLKPDKDVLDFFKEVIESIREFYKLYLKYDETGIMNFRIRDIMLSKKCINIMKNKKEGNAVLMHYLSSMIEKLHHASEEFG